MEHHNDGPVPLQSGTWPGGIPWLRFGHGPRRIAIVQGASALFRRPDRAGPPTRLAARYGKLVRPGARCWVLGFPEPAAGADFTLDFVADRLAEALGSAVGRVDALVGVSLGGLVATRMAARHPELCARLALLVSAHRFSMEGERRMQTQQSALQHGDLAALLRANVLLFRRPWLNALAWLKLRGSGRKLAEECRPAADLEWMYRQLFAPHGLRQQSTIAKRFPGPAMVIGGGRDPFFDLATLAEAAAAFPVGQLRLAPRETHMLPAEQPAFVAESLAELLLMAPGTE